MMAENSPFDVVVVVVVVVVVSDIFSLLYA